MPLTPKYSKDLSNLENIKLNAFVYGKPKTGKRTFASTFPKPHIIDTDGGMLSLRHLNIPYYNFTTGTALIKSQEIKACARELINTADCESIIFSSLTTISDIFLEGIQLLNGRVGKTPKYDPEWAALKNQLNELIALGVKSDKHICFIAHEKVDKCEKTGRVSIAPALTGQLAQSIGLHFDEVYHAETTMVDNKYVYQLLIRELGLYNAGSRLLNRTSDALYCEPNFYSIMRLAGITK